MKRECEFGFIVFQIKTTSPDKYRVRPSAGVIAAGAGLNITVHIQSGYSASQLVRDKFLVMACVTDSETLTNHQLAEVWKVRFVVPTALTPLIK